MITRWLLAVAALGGWLAGMTAFQAADTWPVGKSALENGSLADPAIKAPIERIDAVAAVALPSVAKLATCTEELTAFQRELSSLALLPPAIGPAFPPDRETQTLLAISFLYRAARSRDRLGQEQLCLQLVTKARTQLEDLKPAG